MRCLTSSVAASSTAASSRMKPLGCPLGDLGCHSAETTATPAAPEATPAVVKALFRWWFSPAALLVVLPHQLVCFLSLQLNEQHLVQEVSTLWQRGSWLGGREGARRRGKACQHLPRVSLSPRTLVCQRRETSRGPQCEQQRERVPSHFNNQQLANNDPLLLFSEEVTNATKPMFDTPGTSQSRRITILVYYGCLTEACCCQPTQWVPAEGHAGLLTPCPSPYLI